MFFLQSHQWYHVNVIKYSNPLGEGISSVSVCFCPLPCLGSPTRGSGLMLGALCVRIQSLYSVLVMKDCDKLIYEFRRKLIITFAKKTNLYIKLLYVHFKVFILLSLSFSDYLPLQWLIVRRQFGIVLSNI